MTQPLPYNASENWGSLTPEVSPYQCLHSTVSVPVAASVVVRPYLKLPGRIEEFCVSYSFNDPQGGGSPTYFAWWWSMAFGTRALAILLERSKAYRICDVK